MGEDIILEFIASSLGFFFEFAVLFWQEIVTWASELLVYLASSDTIPVTIQAIELAFLSVSSMAEDIVDAVIASWDLVTQFLLDTVVEIFKSPDSMIWIKRIATVAIAATTVKAEKEEKEQPLIIDPGNRPIIVKKVSEEEVSWEDLPSHIRRAFIQDKSEDHTTIDVLSSREKEINALRMAH